MRELLEFKSDWHYTILKGRHSLPLLSRIDLERHIVERSGHISSLNDSFLSAESFSSALLVVCCKGAEEQEQEEEDSFDKLSVKANIKPNTKSRVAE